MSGPVKTLSKGRERLKFAFGRGKKDITPDEELANKKESFMSAHALAEKRVVELRKTPGADRNDKVKALVKGAGDLSTEIKDWAGKATKVQEVEVQGKRLPEIYSAVIAATTACSGPTNMEAFEKARGKARATLGEMRGLPGATVDPFTIGVVSDADTLINTATDAARNAVSKEEVKEQITALKRISKMKDEAKRGSTNYLKAAPKNLGEFEKKRRAASDRIASVQSLRGTTDDPIAANFFKTAENDLADITTKARDAASDRTKGQEAKNEEIIAAQIKRLAGIEALATQVETASKDAKKRAQGDVKALPKWNELLGEAQKARDSLLEVAIARDEYKELTTLIAKCQLTLAKQGPGEALRQLTPYTDIVKRAENKQKEAKSKVPPVEVLKAVAALSPLLKRLDGLAPEYLAKMHSDENERLAFLGNTDPGKAVTGLEALLVTVQGELKTLETQKTDAETKLKTFQTETAKLIEDGYKQAFFDVPLQLAQLAAGQDLPGREWGRAVERLDNALAGMREVRVAQEKSKGEWEKGDAKRKAMRKLAANLLNWPPLSSRANNLLESLTELDQEFQRTGDYTAVQAMYLSLNLDDVETGLRDAMKDDDTMPDEDKLLDLRKAFAVADERFIAARALTAANLKRLEGLLKGMADPTGTELHEKLKAVQDEWQTIISKPPVNADPGKLATGMIDRLEAISQEASDLLANPKGIAEFEKKSRLFDAKRPDGRLPSALTEMLDQLERSDIQLPAQRRRFATLMMPTMPDDARAEGLLKLQDELKGLVAAEKRKETERVAKTKQAVDVAVTAPLKRIKGRHTEFQDYQKKLETEAGDILAMTESDDPYFLKMARLETVTLAKKVAAVDPKQRGDDAARYKAVEDRWSVLRKGLAGDMKELLPTTHAALRSELAELIGKSRKASPEDGLKMFDSIETRIQAANDKLAVIKSEHDKYKQRRERLEKQWAQVKKDTKTRVTDRTTEFANSLEVRMGEADVALKEENGYQRANKILQTLEDKLRTVEVSEDPRAELQKLDSAVAQEQRAIRDMARNFEEELKFFKETTIPRARKLMQERAAANKSLAEKAGDKIKGAATKVANKLTKTKVGSTDLDVELLESLEATVKNAPKPVQSYLNMISTTGLRAAKTPEMSQAKAAFQSAQGMLASAARTVDALATVTGGTNMSVTQDLKKVEGNWIAQAQNYATVVHAMAKAIRQSAQDETDPTVKAAAEKAAKTVTDAGSAFHPTAFAPEIAALEKKDGTPESKLTAREKALTTMRAYRKLLLEHPVHKHLSDPANPFAEGSKMRAAARGILVGLKRIELETLVGV